MPATRRTDLSAISLREWQYIQRHAEAALVYCHGTHEWSDILNALVAGKMQLWTMGKSMIVTEVVEYPRLRSCRMFLAGGKLDELIEMATDVEKSAAEIGCSQVELSGRRGWEAIGKALGYVSRGYLVKEL